MLKSPNNGQKKIHCLIACHELLIPDVALCVALMDSQQIFDIHIIKQFILAIRKKSMVFLCKSFCVSFTISNLCTVPCVLSNLNADSCAVGVGAHGI